MANSWKGKTCERCGREHLTKLYAISANIPHYCSGGLLRVGRAVCVDCRNEYIDKMTEFFSLPNKGKGGTIGGDRDIVSGSKEEGDYKNQLHELLLRIDNGEIKSLYQTMKFIKGVIR